MAIDSVLPPTETRIRCIAKFIASHKEEIENTTKLAEQVFSKHPSISVEEGAKKLQKAIDYYKDCLTATKSAVCKKKGIDSEFKLSIF